MLNEIYTSQTGTDPSREPLEEPDTASHNRNLNGIISTIRDEGPSPAFPGHDDEGSGNRDSRAEELGMSGNTWHPDASIGETLSPGKGHNRYGRNWAAALLERLENPRSVIALVVVVIMLAVIIGVLQSSPDTQEPPVAALSPQPEDHSATDAPDVMLALDEIRTVQSQIISRQNQFEAAIADLKESSDKQWAANAERLRQIQEDQQAASRATSQALDSMQTKLPETRSADQPSAPPEQKTGPAETGMQAAKHQQEWVVNLASFTREPPIREMMARLKRLGIETQQQVVTIDGKTRYRLRTAGFSSKEAAREFASKLKAENGMKDAWVSLR